nr:diguanylate cyclase [Massilia cavernae]
MDRAGQAPDQHRHRAAQGGRTRDRAAGFLRSGDQPAEPPAARPQHALATCERSNSSGALLFIDLDHFKTINDTLGHDKGDQLLLQIPQRLGSCVYESDTLARSGGDEFMVMAENLSEQPPEAARQTTLICQRILRSFAEPFKLEGIARHITVSIGVTLFDKHRANAGELLKQTDLAMYEVKAADRNGMRFFDPMMQTEITARAALEADLRDALVKQEFLLHYQPQIDQRGRVTGAEALLRWHSARRGPVSPAVFIPIAEESGQIVALGQWVLAISAPAIPRSAT